MPPERKIREREYKKKQSIPVHNIAKGKRLIYSE